MASEEKPNGNAAFFEGYDYVEIELPTGVKLRRKPLVLSEAAKFLRLLFRVQQEDADALCTLIEEFPKALDAEEEFQGLTPVECIRVADAFFTASPTRNGLRPEQ